MFKWLKRLFNPKPSDYEDEMVAAVINECWRSGQPVVGERADDGSFKVRHITPTRTEARPNPSPGMDQSIPSTWPVQDYGTPAGFSPYSQTDTGPAEACNSSSFDSGSSDSGSCGSDGGGGGD